MNRKPFLLKPAGKNYFWGGNRLNEYFAKGIDAEPLAETWECSTHSDGLSVIASGEFKGMDLRDFLKRFPEFVGENSLNNPYLKNGEIPILVKFIDAKYDLSVQVHPDDEYARLVENESFGKTEMWYVLDASKGTKLVYGFYHDMDKEILRKSLNNGTVEKYLQKVNVQKDEVFFIKSGIVHAIGAGALVAEIQENSNLTYRIFDYNRKDKNGQLRELHIEKALDVINLKKSPVLRKPYSGIKYEKGVVTELLGKCRYFQVERMILNTEVCRDMVDFQTDEKSFQVLLCIGGAGVLFYGGFCALHFFKGDCIFVPAKSIPIKIHGVAQLLKTIC